MEELHFNQLKSVLSDINTSIKSLHEIDLKSDTLSNLDSKLDNIVSALNTIGDNLYKINDSLYEINNKFSTLDSYLERLGYTISTIEGKIHS